MVVGTALRCWARLVTGGGMTSVGGASGGKTKKKSGSDQIVGVVITMGNGPTDRDRQVDAVTWNRKVVLETVPLGLGSGLELGGMECWWVGLSALETVLL
ncbi:hypothetical protein NL676_036915 [Syzygium grande]|nr:hypothetical protein NL676_036915 [Syzygium grande]